MCFVDFLWVQVAVSIMKQHDRRQLNLKLRHRAEEQRMKALAGAVGKMITDFWSNMIEVSRMVLSVVRVC